MKKGTQDMKHAKKLVSALLTMVMVFAMSVTAFAANGTNSNDGKIKIDNAVVGQTYTVYQILSLESYDTDSNAYSYKATDDWKSFVEGQNVANVYLKTDEDGYVTWVDKADVVEFTKLAKAYAETLTSNQGQQKATSATVEFTDLNLGYYLVDSTLGTLCSLNTTKPEVTIQEKNKQPTNEKTVEEDSNNQYGNKNDADIGQTVNFKSTITAQAGAKNYVFHDKMSTGLTFGSVTGITLNGTTVDTSNYEVKTSDLGDECTFHVVFTQAFCDTLKANDQIVISYTATLNANAVVGGEGNPNESWLDYGDDNHTTHSTTTTYTWSFDVLKYGNGDKKKVLEGAEFVLLNNDKTKVATIENGKLTGWVNVPAAGNDGTITWPANTVQTTNAQGKIDIAGLDADTYYLREIKAPDGYNKLNADVEVKIEPTTSNDGKTLTLTPITAEVNNQSGSELPSTGGMGTSILYTIGGILVIGAGVLLVVKRRMSAEE